MTTFDRIVGHEKNLSILRRALAANRLHHSLLFHGPEGVGKRTVALAVAAALNCLDDEASNRGDACGTCPSCAKVGRNIHPDVSYVTLERTVIPIDAVRRLRDEATYRPFEGRRRVFIVDPADRMSIDAQNALLKTLEEPSSVSSIVLVTTRPMHLLPTTRSRCQGLGFGTLPAALIVPLLRSSREWTDEDATRAARLCGGRPGAALSLDLEEYDGTRDALLDILTSVSTPRFRDHVLEDIDAFGTGTEEIGRGLEILRTLTRDMILLCGGAPHESLIHAEIADRLRDLGEALGPGVDVLLRIGERIDLAAADLERNVNRKLLLETLLFDIAAPVSP